MIAQDDMHDNGSAAAKTEAQDGYESSDESVDKKLLEKKLAANESKSIVRRSEGDDSSSVPLWLITFTDVMALMLTFFVLLYSMSSPQEEKWEVMSKGLTQKLNVFDAANFRAGTQDVVSLDKIDTTRALNVGYVKIVLGRLLEQKNITDVMLIENGRRLVISLPSDLLFQSGQTKITDNGRQALFELGGVFTRVKNRIEVIGHTDPRPIVNESKDGYKTNWQLSLARAAEVARVLKDVGYDRDITVRGLSSARFDELPEKMSQEERYTLSRRVDIIIMNDGGYRLNAFDM
jgi:chemotaxis protein MotB